MDDMQELARNEIASVERLITHMQGFVESDTMEGLALLLIGVEFNLGQAKADAWAFYQRMKLGEARVGAAQMSLALQSGVLDGRNEKERAQKETAFKNANEAITGAQDATLTARNMNDCVANAHSTVSKALSLVIGMVGNENSQ
ncbi:MAG: hypothetical protein GWN93_05850 [Deltaproteobacteria bacterium]|nr:hypothetical protein [Deltaproteobacteria bacterium]